MKGAHRHFFFFCFSIVGSGKTKILLICNGSLLSLAFSSGLYSQTVISEGKQLVFFFFLKAEFFNDFYFP